MVSTPIKRLPRKSASTIFADEVREYSLNEWATTTHFVPNKIHVNGYIVIEGNDYVDRLSYSHYPAQDDMTDLVSIKNFAGVIYICMRKVYSITGDYETDSKIFKDYESRMQHYADIYKGYLESGMGYNLSAKKLKEEIDKDIGVLKEV